MPQLDEADADALPPSAKYVHYVLATEASEDDPLTVAALEEKTGLPYRTVRYALGRLEEEELLEMRRNFADARQRDFWVPESGSK